MCTSNNATLWSKHKAKTIHRSLNIMWFNIIEIQALMKAGKLKNVVFCKSNISHFSKCVESMWRFSQWLVGAGLNACGCNLIDVSARRSCKLGWKAEWKYNAAVTYCWQPRRQYKLSFLAGTSNKLKSGTVKHAKNVQIDVSARRSLLETWMKSRVQLSHTAGNKDANPRMIRK